MDSFIAILNDIKSGNSRQLIESLHQFFCDVTSLQGDDELVAAYQTVMALKDSSPTPEYPLFEHARKAIVAQMQQGIYTYTTESGCRTSLVARFTQVTGEEFKDSE